MDEIHSYPKVYALGHKAIDGIFNEPVVVQEKIDGSQFSFMKSDNVYCRSRKKMIYMDNPEDLFKEAINSVKELSDKLHPGWVYRGEYLRGEKHNVLKYNRIPKKHIILFDIEITPTHFLSVDDLKQEAERIGLEVVPTYLISKINSVEDIEELLKKESCLGGTQIEGVVFKNYNRFCTDGKTMMGKYVREEFKEKHSRKKYKQTSKDIIHSLGEYYKTEARWNKAIQHLREKGNLEGSPRDIGALIKEVQQDIYEECEDEIKEELFKWAWKSIARITTAGLPEWYKRKLMEEAFNNN